MNAGDSGTGLATTGKGIQVVEAINGATTEEGAFVQGNMLQAGAFNYTLNRDSDESWYLRSEERYRAEVPLYASMLTQAMDYDRILAGSRSHQTGVNGEITASVSAFRAAISVTITTAVLPVGPRRKAAAAMASSVWRVTCSEQRSPVCH